MAALRLAAGGGFRPRRRETARHLQGRRDLHVADVHRDRRGDRERDRVGDVGASGSSNPSMKRSRTSGVSPWTWAKMSVATRPGQISVTRTRLPKASMRSCRESMLTAALVA